MSLVATAERWRCTTCKRERTVTDALPPLKPGLFPRWRVGKCKGCRATRTFESVTTFRDLPEGERQKAAGMAVANRGAETLAPNWTARFDATIKALALSRREFTSEDVTVRAGMPPVGSGSSVGSRMNAAAKRGTISWTGRVAKAERPNQHAAMLKVWRGA